MNSQVRRYYRKFNDEEIPLRLFHDVLPLHETASISWQESVKKAADLPKGWFELSRLSLPDRLDFTRQFWLDTLPYVPHIHEFLELFFSRLDDVGVFLTQTHFDAPYQSELVYSLRDGSCFFRGVPSCTEEKTHGLNQKFQTVLPEDYLAFLRIHDGFSKFTDRGLIPSEQLRFLSSEGRRIQSAGKEVNPKDLIPFYESFEEKNYQCFYLGWTPGDSIGNVFYSANEGLISDISNPKRWAENLAFPTFLDWLILYLEGIEG